MVSKSSGNKNKCAVYRETADGSYSPLSCSATFHGWKDVDLIVRSIVVEEDDDDLNEGFCHYSIVDDE